MDALATSYAAWIGLAGVAPDAWSETPWTVAGTGGSSALDTETGELEIATDTESRWYERTLLDGDGRATTRANDIVDVQAPIRIDTDPGSYSTGIVISDGVRVIGITVGAGVYVSTPISGLVATIATSGPFYAGAVLRVVKRGTAGVEVYVDGVLLQVVPYNYGVAVTDAWRTPRVAWGQFDPAAGAATSTWTDVEIGLNQATAPAWKTDKARDTMPVALMARWTPLHDALVRAFVGAEQTHQDAMTRVARDEFTAGRLTTFTASGSGAGLPSVGNTLEVEGSAGALSVVRQRIRVASESSGVDDGVRGTWGTTLNDATRTEYVVRARVTVVAINATGATNQYVGPYLDVREGHTYRAALRYDADGYFWSLVRPNDNTNYSAWRVDPFQAHDVELIVLKGDRVLLVIDGRIVAEQIATSWQVSGNTTTAHAGRVAVRRGATLQASIDLEDLEIRRGECDTGRRPLLLLRAAERMIAFGGCERNDRLETWVRNRFGVHAARGTDAGIRVELARIGCSAVVTHTSTIPFGWYLNVSYPQITPVWLNADGEKRLGGYYITPDAPGMTVQQICDWAAEHLLPASTLDSVFRVGMWVQTTSGFSASGINWTASYASTDEVDAAFPVGAEIVVLKAGGTTPVDVTVTASGSNSITVRGADLTGYNTGSYIVATLATS